MEIDQGQRTWEGYVDWRGKPALRGRHGGMVAASFVLVVEVLENLAFLTNGSNLVRYFSGHMNLSPGESANAVTNFMGTAFLLALLGGFLSDAIFTTYLVYLISTVIELLGLVVLTIQACSASLQPPKCNPATETPCPKVHGSQAVMLFGGLYLVALGVGGIKGSLPSHGADQFDEESPNGRIQRSTFFNYFIFCLSAGGLITVTLVVWVEDNKGWQWGFAIATMAILLSILIFLMGSKFYRNKTPSGSPLTTIAKVLLAAILKVVVKKAVTEEEGGGATPSNSLAFLNRAVGPTICSMKCSVEEVEDVKIVLKILPIFATTIILNCCLAQLTTFSVHQAATMDTKLGKMRLPPASLSVFPIIFMMALAPVYDHFIVPFARKATKTEMGISHLQRIGTGLVLSVLAMAVAALVEIKRKRVAENHDLLNSKSPLPITFFWVALQYLFLGSADLFTLAGMMEFFFTEAPPRMRSLATALSWASLAMGYYLSSVMVSVVNSATESGGAWLKGPNLNHYHLDRFYWLMCILSGVNFLHYLFWAMRYRYRSVRAPAG